MVSKKSIGIILICLLAFGLVTGSVYASDPETDLQRTTVTVEADGDATWEIEILTALEDQNEVEEYQAWETEVEQNNEEYREEYQQRFGSIVTIAEDALEREMAAEDVSVTTEIEQTPTGDWGITRISFTWSSFASVEDETIRVGDVFYDGYALGENETLVIVAPEEYEVEETTSADTVEVTEVRFNGPKSFGSEEPTVLFTKSDDSNANTQSSNDTRDDSDVLLIISALIGIIALLVSGYLVRKRRTGDEGEMSESSGESTGSELKTDAEVVKETIQQNGGRMKQKALGEHLDWSDAKVSRVTKSMQEDDELEKLRLGRENVIEIVE